MSRQEHRFIIWPTLPFSNCTNMKDSGFNILLRPGEDSTPVPLDIVASPSTYLIFATYGI